MEFGSVSHCRRLDKLTFGSPQLHVTSDGSLRKRKRGKSILAAVKKKVRMRLNVYSTSRLQVIKV